MTMFRQLTKEDLNLDALCHDDLMLIWIRFQYHPRNWAKIIFKSCPGSVSAIKKLAKYAVNKAAAITLRSEGNIERAQVYEAICQKIYQSLPEWARW
jgi:hypothetical protein